MAELTAIKTPITKDVLFTALGQAWLTLFATDPSRESLLLLLSQWGLETGHGSSMWCFNLGNVKAKASGSYDYCYFACNEVLKHSDATRYAAADPERAKITAQRTNGTDIIWFYPKHPGCCFRAFHTLAAGAQDYLAMMHRRFSAAWPAVLIGDPQSFCHALRLQGYYTADEAAYTAGVVSILNSYKKALVDVPLPQRTSLYDTLRSADFNVSTLVTPTEDEVCEIYSPFSMSLLENTNG